MNDLAKNVELLLMDVDGVLTDGRLFFIPMSNGVVAETKGFDVMDGAGISFARQVGLKTGVITRRQSASLRYRAEELKMDYIYNGVFDKALVLEEICRTSGISPSAVCYIGDDLHDLPVLLRVGFPVAVRNAHPELQARAAYVTAAYGGRGAVREVIEVILKAQNKWAAILESFLS